LRLLREKQKKAPKKGGPNLEKTETKRTQL